MRTGRPRAFCVDETLDRAMMVFWRHGYEGASMSDLTAAMGINSPSLYACFGSKEGLFRAVLERYEERRKTFMEYVLAADDVTEMASRFLRGVADFAADTSGKNPPGCLLLQSGLSCGEDSIPDELARHRAEKEKALRARLETARKKGELAKEADPASLARYLITVSNGICVQAASGASAKELHEVAELALKAWPVTARRPRKKTRVSVSA
ncbi:MAG TPA: TetR/AcrR family transcriptional regulator [Rhizomicrobium sp.]|nr:TetR/AcrR family transcriptional regulator [Rhizomicrobium sp.]